jgi:hypothetical protein
VVTRADLPPGSQAVQAAHAVIDFAITYPRLTASWHAASNTLVILVVPDELALSWLEQDARTAGLRVAPFHEPDLGDALTAVAIEPAAGRLLRRLPLALHAGEEVKP